MATLQSLVYSASHQKSFTFSSSDCPGLLVAKVVSGAASFPLHQGPLFSVDGIPRSYSLRAISKKNRCARFSPILFIRAVDKNRFPYFPFFFSSADSPL